MSKNVTDKNILYKLLSLPKQNLETKLCRLEKQLIERNGLSDNFLTKLFTQKRGLKQFHKQQRYQPNDILRQIVFLETNIQKEQLNCFHDVAELSDKINLIHEDLALSSIKLTMLNNEN